MPALRRVSVQPAVLGASSSPERAAADHHFHHRYADEDFPNLDGVGRSSAGAESAGHASVLRRMSLPSLVGGLGKASAGLHNWHSKVLAKKVARSTTRQEAYQIAKTKNLVTVETTTSPTSPAGSSSPVASPSAGRYPDKSKSKIQDPYNYDSEDSDGPDQRDQGNLEFYNDDNLLRREHLRYHASIIKTIDKWWRELVLPLFDANGDGNIQRDEYTGLYKSLLRALSHIFHLKRRGKAGRAAQQRLLRLEKSEWESDSQGLGFIDKERFRTCVFELVDIWCDDISSEAYTKLCNKIFQVTMTKATEKRKETRTKVWSTALYQQKSDLQYRASTSWRKCWRASRSGKCLSIGQGNPGGGGYDACLPTLQSGL